MKQLLDLCHYYVFFQIYFFLGSVIFKTADEPIFKKTCEKMAMGCNRKVKVLVSKLFWSVRKIQKGHFPFGLSIKNATG